jgi:quinol monooxygenase YgiN
MMARLFQLMLAVAALALISAPLARAQEAANPAVYVVRYIDAAPAGKDQVATLLRRLADASRKETGAMRFEVLQRAAPSNQFVILEVWKDQDGLEKHVASVHSNQFSSELAPLLIAPVDERLCVATSVAPLPPMHGPAAVLVVTHVDVGPPNRDKAAIALKALAESSRKDSGNLRFDVVHQKARTNHFTMIEGWKDQESDDAHELAIHTKEFRATLAPLAGALYDQRWYKSL